VIIKNFELDKKIQNIKIFLLYGKNNGFIDETIKKLLIPKIKKKIFYYYEDQILSNLDEFKENIYSQSFFDKEKLIIINNATDKILGLILEILEKKINDVSLILKSGTLEKKSKLRKFFEESPETICVAFYSDTISTLQTYGQNFIKKNNIKISQEDLNLIINKSNEDRGILNNELEKIKFFTLKKKNVTHEEILKLTTLIENHSVEELIKNCLAKNHKRTITILNENNFSKEDVIVIIKTFAYKLKYLLKLVKEYNLNKNIAKTIQNSKPPIFWKDKDIIIQQIHRWTPNLIYKTIFDLSELELQVKKNNENTIFMILNFIINCSRSKN